MLTHKNAVITWIYADLVNPGKREAANRISFKKGLGIDGKNPFPLYRVQSLKQREIWQILHSRNLSGRICYVSSKCEGDFSIVVIETFGKPDNQE